MSAYYVDTAGDDGNSGESELLPWLTVSHAQTTLTGDQHDNSLLFKCGCTWREQFTVGCSGTLGHPFTINSYSTGAKPIIKGSNIQTGFADQGSNVWDVALTTEPKGVWFSGVVGTLAASKAAITGVRQWFWASNVLSVYGTSDPSGTIEACVRDRVIQISGKSYVTVIGLDTSHANVNLVNLSTSNYCIVSANYIHDSPKGCVGIWQGTATHTIQNNEIARSGQGNTSNGQGCAIMISSGTGGGSNIIEKNYIHDIGGVIGDHCIYCQTAENVIRYNLFKVSTGRSLYNTGGNAYVYGNICNATAGGAVCTAIGAGTTYFYNNTVYGIAYPFMTLTGSTGLVVKNCIIAAPATRIHDIQVTTGVIFDYNIYSAWVGSSKWDPSWCANFATWQSTSGQDGHSSVADPLFTNAAGGDFTLQVGSPCIDAGVDLGTTYQMALAPGSTWP